MAKFTVGDEVTVTDSADVYNKRHGVIEYIEGEGVWYGTNEKVYRVKLNSFRGYLWFSNSELSLRTEYEAVEDAVIFGAMSRWLSG